MFAPRTASSKLTKMLKEEEKKLSDITGYKVKIQEVNGTQIRRLLCRKNPFQGINCQRPSCMVCKEGGKGDCRRRSVTYQTTCDTCRARNASGGIEDTPENVGAYWGKLHRSAAERSEEHLHDLGAQKDDSHMWKHKLLEHPEDPKVSFTMKVLKKHYSAFERMVTESTLITMNHNTSNILNSKSGYNRSCIPRLTVSMGQRVVGDSLNNNDYTNEEVEQIFENNVRRSRKNRGRDKGENDNTQVPLTNPPSKRTKYQAKRTKKNTSLIPKDREVNDGPRIIDPVKLERQNSVELDHNEQKAKNQLNSNLNLFSIFSRNGEHNLLSEAQNSAHKSKRENFRKPGRKREIKSCPPPRNNFKITDMFKPNPKLKSDSERPNEPVAIVDRSEETEISSVLDKSAVTRPKGF